MRQLHERRSRSPHVTSGSGFFLVAALMIVPAR